ncbi:MBL fold metallo-hydrolase [Promicromonospora sp. Populi]|uniref:MBL fold metallo-hydrolase n=1 Tax=Promicromonospora sp. Populi TaxID=3239420 RepID=UPI0034E19F4B
MSTARAIRLADGVWAYVQPPGGWMVNNMGVVETSIGNISIDTTSTERRMRAYLRTMREATGRDLRYIIYTHSHPDHSNGASMVPDADVIAHREVAAELQRLQPVPSHVFTPFVQGNIRPRPPTVVFDDSLTLHAGSHTVRIVHPGGTAHTKGDAYVWLPETRVLFAGDLIFHGGTPFLMSGSPRGWLAALEGLRALRPSVVVPGHGDIGGPELIDEVADYLRFVVEAAASARARGLSPLQAARQLDLARFAGLLDPERIVGNLHQAYGELDGTPVDPGTVFQEMYEFNGKRPLECHA